MQEDKNTLIAELQVGASYASLMSATSLFFTGILISQYKSFNSTIKVPLIYLIISTFSFIFAATIYSNAGNELTLNRIKTVEKYLVYGKVIVELLGLYLFILAVPLVIGAVTQDSFLRTTTITVALGGFVIYTQSRFSVLEKELNRSEKRSLSVGVAFLALLLYIAQNPAAHSSAGLYSAVSILLLLVVFISAAKFSVKSKQYLPIITRLYYDDDAEEIALIINKNLGMAKRVKGATDKPHERHFSTDSIKDLATKEQLFVAEFDNRVVGFASLNSDTITKILADTSFHKKGTGRALVEKIEGEAINSGWRTIKAQASPYDEEFYKKLGFYTSKEQPKSDDHTVLLEKKIFSNLS